MRMFFFMLLFMYAARSSAQSFGNGNLVVVRIGTGDTPMTAGAAQPVYLDEYTPCGELVRSIALPVAINGSHRRLTLPSSVTDYTEGFISLSEDGQYLALAGYDAAAGTASVTGTTSATVNRTVAVIDASGNVNTTTAFSNRFSAVSIRSAVVNGTAIWAAGGSGGIVYAALGSTGTSNTQITTLTGRCLGIYDGQLYTTSTATGFRMARVGAGLPTTAGQAMQNLPGYPSTSGSPLQFFMARLGGSDTVNVLYIADNNVLKKYSLVSGSWVDNGTIGVFGDKYRGVTGIVSDDDIILYTIRRNDNRGELIRFTDTTGYNANFSGLKPVIVAQADTNKVFRSVAMAPQPVLLPLMARSSTSSRSTDFRVLAGDKGQPLLAELITSQPVSGVVNVCDLNGRLLYTRRVTAEKGINRMLLEMPASARGLYMATFIPLHGNILTSKFIY